MLNSWKKKHNLENPTGICCSCCPILMYVNVQTVNPERYFCWDAPKTQVIKQETFPDAASGRPFPSWINKARLLPSFPLSLPHLACFSGRNSRVAARFSDVFSVFLCKERRPGLSRGAIWLEDQSGTRREGGQLSSTPLERCCFLVFDYTRLNTERYYTKIKIHPRDKMLTAECWSTNFCINEVHHSLSLMGLGSQQLRLQALRVHHKSSSLIWFVVQTLLDAAWWFFYQWLYMLKVFLICSCWNRSLGPR